MDDKKYFSEPFNRVAAWVDLLLMASVKDNVIYIRGVEVEVKRGQVAISEVELAKRWKIGRKLVRRYLSEFEMAQQIAQQKNRRTHLISITNYEKFQDTEQQKEQQKINQRVASDMLKESYPIKAIAKISRLSEDVIRGMALNLGLKIVN